MNSRYQPSHPEKSAPHESSVDSPRYSFVKRTVAALALAGVVVGIGYEAQQQYDEHFPLRFPGLHESVLGE